MRNSHVFVAAFFIILSLGTANSCSLLATQPMTVTQSTMEPLLASWKPTDQQLLSCLRFSLTKGLFSTAQTLISLSPTIKHTQFHHLYTEQLKLLTHLSRSLVTGWTRLFPVLKWAQSNQTILISFKLSHRWDSPPCTSTKSSSFTFENNTLDYQNECIVSRQRIYFRLNLTFWGEVQGEGVEVKKDGVGTYVVTVRKRTQGVWAYLDVTKQRYPIWGEIADRYKGTMDAYAKMLENFEEKSQ